MQIKKHFLMSHRLITQAFEIDLNKLYRRIKREEKKLFPQTIVRSKKKQKRTFIT